MAINIERFFADQIREQRKAASGSFHKRGKGVKHGINSAFRTPYFFMTTKEKKKLNGEVTVTNMYETIIDKDEFFKKPRDIQKAMLTRWREIFPTSEIKKQMNISSNPFYKLLDELEIAKKDRKDTMNIARKAKLIQKQIEKQIEEPKAEVQKEVENYPTPIIPDQPITNVAPILITRGLHLEYNGDYTSEEISRIFQKLQILTEGEKNKFKISISVTEMV